MADWVLEWNFDKATYQPCDVGKVHLWIENTGDSFLYVTEACIQFEFQEKDDQYYTADCSVQVVPKRRRYISSVSFQIPPTIAGILRYRIRYHLWEYNSYTNEYDDLGFELSELKYYINVVPAPYYRAFISRGIRPEDRLVGDEIVEMIRQWGFETITVGIEEFATDKLREFVKDEIIKSDCLVAVVAPRYLDALNGLWRTLEWLHGEVGIAYGVDRPIIILEDDRVAVEGLPGEFGDFAIPFNVFNLEDLRQRLGVVMPSWREWVATRRREDFLRRMAKVAAPLLVGGAVGIIIGRSKGPSKGKQRLQ